MLRLFVFASGMLLATVLALRAETDDEDAKENIRQFAVLYIAAGNVKSVDLELGTYAESVDFYDKGILTRAEIRGVLVAHRQKWPTRRYTVTKVFEVEYHPVLDQGAAIVEYTFQVANGRTRLKGTARSFVRFASASGNPKVVFVRERPAK